MSRSLPNFYGLILKCGYTPIQLLGILGHGSHGSVYLAQDLTTFPEEPRYFAVKCLSMVEKGRKMEAIRKREIDIHAKMSRHPNVIALHYIAYHGNYVFLVMDLCDGGDLFQAIVDREIFLGNDDCVKRAFIQILSSVQACHNAGIFHRDLKPENILCSEDDTVFKLSDFGLATSSARTNSYGCGSRLYMAPECFGPSETKKGPYSTREADVWALGIILFNMLTGEKPWKVACGESDEKYAQYLIQGWRYFLSAHSISREAALLLCHFLDPDPRSRSRNTIPKLRKRVREVVTFFPERMTPVIAPPTSPRAEPVNLEIVLRAGGDIPTSLNPMISITIENRALSREIGGFVNQAGPYSSHTADVERIPTRTQHNLVIDIEEASGSQTLGVHVQANVASKGSVDGVNHPAGLTVHRIVHAFHRFVTRS